MSSIKRETIDKIKHKYSIIKAKITVAPLKIRNYLLKLLAGNDVVLINVRIEDYSKIKLVRPFNRGCIHNSFIGAQDYTDFLLHRYNPK